ncbi:MAG: NADPH-dependent stearoyl-CoA 9-desaturase [Solirubrobacteraceae bacterium]|nr:NADPH-dependent stearoyl-CoA 9-desaturase [Solirubrobacteraceae bacterium]
MTTQTPPQLTPEQLEEFGREIDAIRERVTADLGERDAAYIRRIVKAQRGLEIGGRSLLFASFLPPAWLAGTAALSLSKILDNMEIGHNVLHGQYDWMNDEALNSITFEWDMACPSEGWRHQHNYIHHTHTNVLGKDRDIGFGIMRMSEDQRWHPYYLSNPALALLIALFFEWGVAFHDLELFEPDESSERDMRETVRDVVRTGLRQTLKDFALFPALAGPAAPATLAANVTATAVRNLWAFTIIFCGHFPEGTREFTEEETENETRGEWYYRQLLGSANITGGPLFHILSGNLGHQIEHHLFSDLPAHRYAELSVEVREICERYELPYNVGPLSRQFGGVVKKIFRLALP